MSIKEHPVSNVTPMVSPGNYSPVTVYVQDSIGALFLGIFAVLFWIGWMRAETRFRALRSEKETTHGNH